MSSCFMVEVCFPLPFTFLTIVVVEVLTLGVFGIPGVVGFCLTWIFCGLVLPLATLTGVAVLVVEAFVTMELFNGIDLRL